MTLCSGPDGVTVSEYLCNWSKVYKRSFYSQKGHPTASNGATDAAMHYRIIGLSSSFPFPLCTSQFAPLTVYGGGQRKWSCKLLLLSKWMLKRPLAYKTDMKYERHLKHYGTLVVQGSTNRWAPRFGEFCSCSCLPLLPQIACSIHATWGPPISGAL